MASAPLSILHCVSQTPHQLLTQEYDERKGYGYQEPRDKDYNYLKATNPYPSPSIVCPECALTCPNITCEPADCNCEAQSCNCEPQSCTCGACSPAACTCSPTCDCPDIDFSKFPACPACPECKPTQTQECITNIDTCCNGGDCPVKCPPTQLFCDPECVVSTPFALCCELSGASSYVCVLSCLLQIASLTSQLLI